MMLHTDLGSWLREFDRLYDLTFREVALIAVGVTTSAPVLGSPHPIRRRSRTTKFRGWKPSYIGYISSSRFRPAQAWIATPPVSVFRTIGIALGSPTIGVPRLGLAARTFGEFTRRHRWQPVFHTRLE